MSGRVSREAPPAAQTVSQSTASPREDGDSVADRSGKKISLPVNFGRYRLLKSLGQGAMGAVYLARDTQLERDVALKVPKFSAGEKQELLERFFQEARAAAVLRHPHICPVYDVGEIDGTSYLTMAYIEGRPLSDFVNAKSPMREREAALLIRKLAAALEEAHEAGIIHRDLKPRNVMLDRRGEPVILDFGLARQLSRPDGTQLTHMGAIIGSPAYMSPEQVDAKLEDVGPATDVYSLGVVLYELLTGELPFRGSVASVFGQIMSREPPLPSQVRPGLDPRLEAICLKMMAKRIEDRYASMAEVAAVMDEYLSGPEAGPAGGMISTSSRLLINEDEIRLKDDEESSIVADQPPIQTSSALDARMRQLAEQKEAVAVLLREQQYAAAARSLKEMAALKDPRLAEYVDWAEEKLPRVKKALLTMRRRCEAALQEAQNLMKRRDFEKAAHRLQQVPAALRTEAVSRLLDRAMELADEVSFLLAEVEQHLAREQWDEAVPKLERLLALKPGDRRIQELYQQLNTNPGDQAGGWFRWK